MSSDPPETRERILQATLALLEANQSRAVRMGDIATRAGISRQAVYLHFDTRADLLIATTKYVEDINAVEEGLRPSRTASTGLERLDAYIDAWSGFLPKIHDVAKALIVMSATDPAAAAAWDGRMQAMRSGCAAAIAALHRDGQLSRDHTPEQATDILWTLLSFHNWEQFRQQCGWSQADYGARIKSLARQILVAPAFKQPT